jgi:hypothetical protein
MCTNAHMCSYKVSVVTVQLSPKLVCANKFGNIPEFKTSCMSFQLFYSHYMQTKGQTNNKANRYSFATSHF